MFDIRLVQSAPGAVPAAGVVWRTCVREIAFVDGAAARPGGLELVGEDAYAHLLAVICGLRSPIAGETEVMHQFKGFVAGLPSTQAPLRSLAQRLLADAGEIRTRHMVGMGPQSYGSAVRRRVKDCDRVAVIGTGMLAEEILRFIADGTRTVDLWGRRDAVALGGPRVTYRRIGAGIPDSNQHTSTALVLAAPIPAADATAVIDMYPSLSTIVDLRGEGAHDPVSARVPVTTLPIIFEDLKAAAQAIQHRIHAAEDDVRHRARAFALTERPRPSGWHDLCA